MKKHIKLAVLITAALLTALCGCGDRQGKRVMKTLTWYYINDSTAAGGSVFSAANDIIAEKMGIQVRFEPIRSEEYSKKMQLKASAAEKFDLAFTSDWAFNYRNNVQYGTFAPIETLIDRYAPKTRENVIQKVWDGITVNSHIYAVPNYQVSFRQAAIVIKKELADKYNLKGMIDSAQCMADFTPVLQVIRDNEPGIVPTIVTPQVWSGTFGDDTFYTEKPLDGVPVGVDLYENVADLTKDPYKEQTIKNSELSRLWQKNGFYSPDSDIRTDYTAEKRAGKIFMFDDVYKPGLEVDMQTRYGYPVYVKPVGVPQLSNSSASAALTAVSRTCTDKVTAVKLIELLNTDKKLYNLLVYGIEGRDYKKVSKDTVKILSNRSYSANAWVMGSQFNAYFIEGQKNTIWEETKKLNAAARTNSLLGKELDISAVKQNIARIEALYSDYDVGAALRGENSAEILERFYSDIQGDVNAVCEEIRKQIAK